jgi:hypothetical protein
MWDGCSVESSFLAKRPRTRGRLSASDLRHAYCTEQSPEIIELYSINALHLNSQSYTRP